jgi:hypothetical protein
MKKIERGANFFLKLLIHRERRRPGARRLVIRLHAPKLIASAPKVRRHFAGRN